LLRRIDDKTTCVPVQFRSAATQNTGIRRFLVTSYSLNYAPSPELLFCLPMPMDKHYLTPLFSPTSIVVFAGKADDPDSQSKYGRSICTQIRESGFAGPVTFLDVGMSGTLGELAHSRADLAIIALPNEELLSALEVAGRIQC
jgi:hypothetical protein